MYQVLVVEDDDALREGIAYALKREGYQVKTAGSLEELQKLSFSQIHVVLLDISLPDGDGRHYLKELRKTSKLPVIFLTAHNTEADMIQGFDIGADDYMTKPFSIPLLLRRLRAVLLRSQPDSSLCYQMDDLIYQFAEKKLTIAGRVVNLSKTELRLLETFLQNRNQVLTSDILLERVWDIDGNFVDKNTLSVAIARLREKIEVDRKHPKWIRNVFGIGYKWSDQNET